MTTRRWGWILACLLLLRVLPAWGQAQVPPTATPDQGVPAELRSLLVPPQSEMRLVTLRYIADRGTLNGNYVVGGRGGGRGGSGSEPALVSLSTSRIARLMRFDMDWQAALSKIDASRLTVAARSDLEALQKTIQANLTRLAADAESISRVMPLVPFAPRIVQLAEARTRLEDIDPEKAAGVVSAITQQIAVVRVSVEAGLTGQAPPEALRVGKDLAMRGAAAVDLLRGGLSEWFTFYNGYDPLFTWWMGLPIKQADTALQGTPRCFATRSPWRIWPRRTCLRPRRPPSRRRLRRGSARCRTCRRSSRSRRMRCPRLFSGSGASEEAEEAAVAIRLRAKASRGTASSTRTGWRR